MFSAVDVWEESTGQNVCLCEIEEGVVEEDRLCTHDRGCLGRSVVVFCLLQEGVRCDPGRLGTPPSEVACDDPPRIRCKDKGVRRSAAGNRSSRPQGVHEWPAANLDGIAGAA